MHGDAVEIVAVGRADGGESVALQHVVDDEVGEIEVVERDVDGTEEFAGLAVVVGEAHELHDETLGQLAQQGAALSVRQARQGVRRRRPDQPTAAATVDRCRSPELVVVETTVVELQTGARDGGHNRGQHYRRVRRRHGETEAAAAPQRLADGSVRQDRTDHFRRDVLQTGRHAARWRHCLSPVARLAAQAVRAKQVLDVAELGEAVLEVDEPVELARLHHRHRQDAEGLDAHRDTVAYDAVLRLHHLTREQVVYH